MADSKSGETIREMLQGWNAMQMQLGITPINTAQTPMGVSFQPPPPPPQIPHPSEVAMQAVAQQQAMMAQTLQAAQMTRYIPPPSTPIGGGGGYSAGGGFQPLNPYAAGAIGGGMAGMPNPMTMTSPMFGMYRPGGHFAMPHVGQGPIPPIFNPFAPQVQPSHFMSPAMQNFQIMQGIQSRGTAMAAGMVDGAFSFGGAALGGVLGSRFGAFGTMAGGFLGHSIGGFLGNMAMGPGMIDATRGRQIQNMTAPWTVAGPMLNPFTGHGLDREAGRATAMGLRHLATRDHDFGRTGFNTEDVMRITQLSNDQGLLATARSPDEIVRRVKDISKAVKVLAQVTGDPDVRNAIAAIGQMKDLGFIGLAGQAGAVANRAAFARMAGVSQAAMHDLHGMPGAMMAQQAGLVGATGYGAGMAGGAAAHIARTSGALDALQMARAGGAQGLAQINTMAQLSSVNQEVYMAAALKRGAKGIDIDIDAYRRAQNMAFSDVVKIGADNLRDLGKEGLFELRTRKQEFKDKLAQQMAPFEMSMNVVRQAQGLQKSVPGMNFGSALFATARSNAVGAGMSDEQAEAAARSLEVQFQSREFWDGQIQQLKAQRRQIADQERAKRDQYRTPGLMTRMERGAKGFFNDASDFVSSPFRSLSARMDRVAEEEAAMKRGERIFRTGSSALIQNDADRALARQAILSPEFQGGEASTAQFDQGWLSGMGNRVGSLLRLSKTSAANRINEIAHRTNAHAFGHTWGESFGDAQASLRRVQDVSQVGRAMDRASAMTDTKFRDTQKAMRESLAAHGGKGGDLTRVIFKATSRLHTRAPTAGYIDSAGAMSGAQMKASIIETLTQDFNMSKESAEKFYESNKDTLDAEMAAGIMSWGDEGVKETMMKSKDAQEALGGLMNDTADKDITKKIKRLKSESGLGSATEKELSALKKLMGSADSEVLKMASLLTARGKGDDWVKQRAIKAADEYMVQLGDRGGEIQRKARKLVDSADPEALRALRRVVGGGATGKGTLSDISGRFDLMDDVMGARMGEAAQRFTIEQISSITGRKDYGSDVDKAISSLVEEDIEGGRFSKQQKELIRRAQKGDKQARADLILSMGPKSEKELLSGSSGGALRNSDELIAQMEQLKAEVAAEGGDKATQLLADGSMALVKASEELQKTSDNLRNAMNSPWFQGLFGGG